MKTRFVLLVGILSASSLFAGTIYQLSDNSGLSDIAAWSGLGAQSYPTPVCTSACSVTSTGGIVVSPTSTSAGALYRVDDGSALTAPSPFNPGDALLLHGFRAGAMTLTFSQAVAGVGLLMVDQSTANDTFSMTAYNAQAQLLGVVTVSWNGFTNTAPEFVGLADASADISSVVIQSGEGLFAVDTLNLADSVISSSSSSVPEPSSLGLAGLAILSLSLYSGKSRAKRLL